MEHEPPVIYETGPGGIEGRATCATAHAWFSGRGHG